MKSEIFSTIIGVVSSECEISEDDIRSHCKSNDVVDARCIFVFYCHYYGLPSASIAKFLNRKRLVSISDCLRNHRTYSEQSIAYRLMCNNVGKKLSDLFPDT